MSEPVDEFSFLPEQARASGVDAALPHGERLSLTLPDGRTLSALRYAPAIPTPSPAAAGAAPGASGRVGPDADAGPVVTFLHGAGLNAHTWDTTILALGLPALAIDLPGHGDSSWREDAAYVARVLAPDVAAGIAAWTDRPQLLVGQSLGGLTAAAVAASHPELVDRLVVIDITPGISPTGGPSHLREFFAGPKDWASREELTARALSFGFGGSPEAAARGVFFNSRVRADGRVEWKHHFAHIANALTADSSGSVGGGEGLNAVLGESGWEDLAAVTAPITLIRGDHGYVSADDAEEFARRVPAASLAVVSAGHNVQEDIPVDLGSRLHALVGKD